MIYRICYVCKINKSEKELVAYNRRGKYSITTLCRKCNNIKVKLYQAKMKQDPQWVIDNKEKRKKYSKEIVDGYEFNLRTFERYGGRNNVVNVFKRDKYLCQMCFTGNNLCIHHKDNKGLYYKKRGGIINNNLNNLVLLCKSCHQILHHDKRYQKKYPHFYDLQKTTPQ